MLAEEHTLNYISLLNCSCLQADVTRSPALHKHFNVISHSMKVLNYTIILLLACTLLACGKMETENEYIKTVSGRFIVEDIEPPPIDYIGGNFTSVKEWLTDMSNSAKPSAKVDEFCLGLFEGEDYHVYLVGKQDSVVGNDHYSNIVFEPQFMYYKLLEAEYAGLSQEQIRDKVTRQLKAFTSSRMFKSCFLSKAKSFTIEYNGENLLPR